jgi:hypothetical protein
MTLESLADRLISSAQPALAAELNNILDELRSRFESESEVRLTKALLEKDIEHKAELERVRQAMAADAESAVEAKLDEVRTRLEADHEARLGEQLSSRLAALGEQKDAEAQAAAETWNEHQMVLERKLERWRTLAEYHSKIGESSSQLEILRRFLLSGSRFASGVAVYLQKADGLSLWKSEGDGAVFPEVASEGSIDPEWFYSTVVVRGKTVAAVSAAGMTDREALVVMVAALKHAVENFGLRLRFMSGEPRPDADPAPAPASANAPAGTSHAGDPVPPANPHVPEASQTNGHLAGTIEMPSDPAASDPRKVARAIVSEIKLGHEKQVLEGRVNADLYRRLQSPIEEGRKAYASRVNGEPEADYFHEEVVRILADNIVSRLGAEYPGPR